MSETYVAVIGKESDGELRKVEVLKRKYLLFGLRVNKYLVRYDPSVTEDGHLIVKAPAKTAWVKNLYVYRGDGAYKEVSA